MSKIDYFIAIFLAATLIFFVVLKPIYDKDQSIGLVEEQVLNIVLLLTLNRIGLRSILPK